MCIPMLNHKWEIPAHASPQKSVNLNTSSTLTASYFKRRNLVLSVGDPATIKASACTTDAWDVWAPNNSYFCCSAVLCQCSGMIIERYVKVSTPTSLGLGSVWSWVWTNSWPLLMWDDEHYQLRRSVVIGGLSITMRVTHYEDKWRTRRKQGGFYSFFIPFLHFQLPVYWTLFDTRYTINLVTIATRFPSLSFLCFQILHFLETFKATELSRVIQTFLSM